jgi:hypothetical protein
MPAIGPAAEVFPRNRNPRAGHVGPALPQIGLSVSWTEVDGDPAVAVAYAFDVVTSGDTSADRTFRWDVVPALASPIPASRFDGGAYPGGTVTIPAGQPSVTLSITLAASADPPADLFASLALSSPVGCDLAPGRAVWPFKLKGSIVVADAILALDVPDTTFDRDASAQHVYAINVLRTGNLAVSCSATLALAGTGAHPMTAGDFVGGLLSTTVSFAPGDTSVPFTVTTAALAAPAADLTGQVSLSAPTGCKIDPTGASVAVNIPHAIIRPPGVLPPQYTDPDFTGMTPVSPAPTTWTALQTAAAALDNNVLCKTKFIELAASFDYGTTTRLLPWSGYVEPGTGLIYPLVITGPRSSAKTRDPSLKPQFRFLVISGTWLWLYNHAETYPLDGSVVVAGKTWQYQDQPKANPAIAITGTDCFVTRCWIDCPQGIYMGGDATEGFTSPTRARVGANDFYGYPQPTGGSLNAAQIIFNPTGKTLAAQDKPVGCLVYQNFHSQLGETTPTASGFVFYSGEGVDKLPPDHSQPYDLNIRDCWFFNNLILSERKFLIYNKHALNLWRNRVVAVNKWDDTTGTGSAFHYISSRGGNWMGGTVKYNSTEGKSAGNSSCDAQGWNGIVEFNDFNGVEYDIFFHMDQPSGKTLNGANGWRFRGNKNGKYVVGTARNSVYHWYAPLLDLVWEAEQGASWEWQGDSSAGSYNPNGGAIAWDATTGRNTETLMFTESGQPAKTAVAAGQLRKSASTTAVRQLTTAYADADYHGEFTKANKGIGCQDGLVWDHVGDGGGGGDPYALDQGLMTVWWPSDNMPVDYPHTYFRWLPGPGNGFECKAQNNPTDTPHACMNVWHKTAPPDGDCEFNFYATILDANLTADAGADGIFGLFRVRQKGLAAYGANPNLWAKASWRVHPVYTGPGSDFIVRDRTTGYRHSFANHANTTDPSMQFRCLICDGNDNGVDDAVRPTPTTPNPVPTTGTSFLMLQNQKYLLNYRRVGQVATCVKTKVSDGTTQTWAFDDARLGPSGAAVGGWCGFGVYIGRTLRIEPVPGVPFCRAI